MLTLIRFLKFSYFIVLLFTIILKTEEADPKIKLSTVQGWSEKLGYELWHVGDYITLRRKVIQSYEKAQVAPRKGQSIVDEMAKEIKNMFDAKVSAIKRISDAAENQALSTDSEELDVKFSYYNARDMIEACDCSDNVTPESTIRESEDFEADDDEDEDQIVVPPKVIKLKANPRFFNLPVNTTLSSVLHFTNIYDRAPDVIKAIKWSEALNKIFIDNYGKDPTLSWQYFTSSTGFLRQFPAAKWEMHPVDLYDGRMRQWYITAANSPKDVVVLVDNSGSMTGQRRDIAKHVVENILETLGPNDFVNVLTFNETVHEVVPCFNNTLVQATPLNLGEFKVHLEDVDTHAMANFTAALSRAFEMLAQMKEEGQGAHCNQAIMLVTDGVPFTYQEIFELYNWKDKALNGDVAVRVFTYLIGKEVADVDKVKWMACENLGYYVHLSTFSEVREQVLNYVHVMARPLVLEKDHPVIWSELYADIIDPRMTEYEWEVEERREQKNLFQLHEAKKNESIFVPRDDVDKWWMRKGILSQPDDDKFNFMITVSMPVFDRRENASIPVYDTTQAIESVETIIDRIDTRIANLLGVAATDIPLKDLKKLMMPFMLGVNGYAFLVTNNGYVVAHPDHRPIFLNILKPAYNSIDFLEVELVDDDRGIRDFNTFLSSIRESIINQTSGSKWVFVKYHYDSMKRVSRTKRLYFWTGIPDTPYTLVIAYPENYGANRIQVRTEDEIHRIHAKGSNILTFFNGSKWKIHPDWLYCKHSSESFESPEEELRYFLKRMRQPGWKWPLGRTPLPPEKRDRPAFNSNVSTRSVPTFDKDRYFCDRSLMQALVYDAKVTEFFVKNYTTPLNDHSRTEFQERFGITNVFLATHSGLTRWHDFNNHAEEASEQPEFSERNIRAIDEVWYKRAVEQYLIEPESFVYAVPFKVEDPSKTLVTASSAIFITENKQSAPVAVVGFQFRLSTFYYKRFKNVTSGQCDTDSITCYIIDNNGYIVISPELKETGQFFGEQRPDIMQRLIYDGIFKEILIFDYQGVCFHNKQKGSNNLGVSLHSILDNLVGIVQLLFSYVMYILIYTPSVIADAFNTAAQGLDDYTYSEVDPPLNSPIIPVDEKEGERSIYKKLKITKTRPQPCDHNITLYQLDKDKSDPLFETNISGCERPFVITPIAGTNLLLIVIDENCPYDCPCENKLSTDPKPDGFDYGDALACFKTWNTNFPRKRPIKCIRKHENESQIVLCGRSSTINISNLFYFISVITTLLISHHWS